MSTENYPRRQGTTATEDYVSFEIAKLLKEKGFDGDTASCYILEDGTHHIMSDKVIQSEYYESQDSNEYGHLIQAPTLQMAMKWLREVHHIFIQIELYSKYDDYNFEIFQNTHRLCIEERTIYNTYTETVEAAIKCCLENLI